MTWQDVATAVLLVLGTGVELICCLGILAMRDVFDRLHYLGPATTVGPALLAAAVVVQEGLSQAGIKALVIAAILVVTGPVLTHATARAARIRRSGDWTVQPEEEVERL